MPVATPSLAERYCSSIATTFAVSSTHSNSGPKVAPACTLVAKFPGST
jgi:hypothetical protein